MQTTKEQVRDLLDHLPDHATLNDVMYELYVKQKIERGMQASREGRVTPHSCQSAPKTFHPSASNSFHFFWRLSPTFAVLKAVRVVAGFQNFAVVRYAV
jgi:hypothetical protein